MAKIITPLKSEEVTGVPEDEVGKIVQGYHADGALSVQAWKAPPGTNTYTIRATFPAE